MNGRGRRVRIAGIAGAALALLGGTSGAVAGQGPPIERPPVGIFLDAPGLMTVSIPLLLSGDPIGAGIRIESPLGLPLLGLRIANLVGGLPVSTGLAVDTDLYANVGFLTGKNVSIPITTVAPIQVCNNDVAAGVIGVPPTDGTSACP